MQAGEHHDLAPRLFKAQPALDFRANLSYTTRMTISEFEDAYLAFGRQPGPAATTMQNTRAIPLPALPADLADQALNADRPDVQEMIATMVAP